MLKHVLKRFPVRQVVVVADRGLLSLENLTALQEIGKANGVRADFIMALPARRYGDLKAINRSLIFRDGLAESEFSGHRLVVAHDPERAEYQRQAREKRLRDAEAVGERLAAKLDKQDVGDTKAPGRRASDRGAYPRFAQELRDRKITRLFEVDWNADLFSYERNEEAIAAAEAFDGKLYVLTSLEPDTISSAEVIQRYKALADIERGFRVLKSELLIAPVHHRLELRIRAHAVICFLALLLHRVMRARLKRSNSDLSPAAALRLLAQIQRHQVQVGDHAFTGISRRSPEQLNLLEALALDDPQ